MKSHLAIGIAAILMSWAALAHSQKESTIPVDGAQLTETPEIIQMVFDDPMRITMVRLLNADGAEMPMARSTGSEPSLEFQAEPAPLAQGSFSFELTD